MPVTKDAVTGAELLRNLAIIYAWTGEKDLAIKQLEKLLPLYSQISYGQLRLHPWWDPLRDDPRFAKIVEEAKETSRATMNYRATPNAFGVTARRVGDAPALYRRRARRSALSRG
jgi:hypothetical protein